MLELVDPGPLIEGEFQLVLTDRYQGDPTINRAPVYRFDMTVWGQDDAVGRIELRVANTLHIVMYAGHIGYRVFPKYRGHHYAARACRMLLPLARRHELNPLWITCDPENIASRRTCELAGAEFLEIVDLPEDTDMYRWGERRKCRYRLYL